jgi:hypothetical protein
VNSPKSRRPGDVESPARDSGALYVHLQSESGTEHRTFVVPARRARILRALWSPWGIAVVLAAGGSWVYFAVQSARVPWLTSRVAELEAEASRIDTLESRLRNLQQQYDQVTRMFGAARDSADTTASRPRRNPED